MKLLLISLYPDGTMARYLLSSYALQAWLESHEDVRGGLQISVQDYSASAGTEYIRKRMEQAAPDIVGFSCYVWNIAKVRELIQALPPSMPVILGGPEISWSTASQLAAEGLGSYYINGEGETPMLELARHLLRPDSPFPPTVGRRAGRTLAPAQAQAQVDVSALPSPYLAGIVPERLYHAQQAYVETQRGCRYRCAYCVYHRGRSGIEYHSLDKVCQELRHLVVECKVKALRFIDAIFASDLERAKTIVRFLLELRLEHPLPWIYWEFSYSCVDEEFLELLAQLREGGDFPNSGHVEAQDRAQVYSDLLVGYTAINCLGLQSFNAASLKAVGRPAVSLKKFDSFMRGVSRHGAVLKIDLILGLPLETRTTFFDGLNTLLPYLRNTDHVLNVHRLQLLPGTRMEETAESLGLVFRSELPHMVASTTMLTGHELEELSRLTGLLFRVLNSPLRPAFYQALERHGQGCEQLLELLLRAAAEHPDTCGAGLFTLECLDDEYWNGQAFRDLPSAWLRQTLATL